jgi:transcriptional regulator with XRE-family HTH domain
MSEARKKRVKKEDINYSYYSNFPTILRELLEGTTQDKLAEYCGVARQSVAQWKDGKTKPDIYYLEKIAEFFNCSTDYLIGLTDIKSTDKDIQAIGNYTGLEEKTINTLQLINDTGKIDELMAYEVQNELKILNAVIVGIAYNTNILKEICHVEYIKTEIAYLEQISDSDFEIEYPNSFNYFFISSDNKKRKEEMKNDLCERHDRKHWEISKKFAQMIDDILGSTSKELLLDKLSDEEYIKNIKRKHTEYINKQETDKNKNIDEVLADIENEYTRLKTYWIKIKKDT